MAEVELTPEEQDRERRLRWFRAARYGMFIHWGLYAQLGRHEWVMNRERIPREEYEKLAATWKPRPGAPREWAKLAKEAGMRYMVMTSKHHEGFCLWDSKLTGYNAVKCGPGRDLVAEYVEAARAEGLRVGLYYSLMDWHHPDGARCKKDESARRRFVDYTHGLVKELMSNYGKIDILWYDVRWPLEPEEWESEKMNAMVRGLQPDILINNRSGIPEDFGTPEQRIVPEEGGRAWEACMTFNEQSWGYTPIDKRYKTAWDIINMLRQVANGGGNLLLNIGPTPEGDVPGPCVTALKEAGAWLSEYGESIYDASDPNKSERLVTGAFTYKGNTAYFHCLRWPGTELAIGGLVPKVLEARIMNGPKVNFTQVLDRLVIHGLPEEAPNPIDTVFELKCDGKPWQILGPGCEILDDDPWRKPSA